MIAPSVGVWLHNAQPGGNIFIIQPTTAKVMNDDNKTLFLGPLMIQPLEPSTFLYGVFFEGGQTNNIRLGYTEKWWWNRPPIVFLRGASITIKFYLSFRELPHIHIHSTSPSTHGMGIHYMIYYNNF